MTSHKVGTRDEWLAARIDSLKAEKELTRRSDERAAAAGAALGSNRKRLPLRDRRRKSVPR